MPPYLAAIGWILLAGPNAGWINQAWTAVTGDPDYLVNVYTFTGLAVVIALNSFPFIFIFVKAALDMVSSEMEDARSEEHTSELQSLMRISYAVFCLKKKKKQTKQNRLHRM